MKKLYYFLFSLLFSGSAMGQSDTLVFEDFEEDPTANWANFPAGDDDGWVRYDQDGLPVSGGLAEEQNWFWDAVIRPVDTLNKNAIHSLSFMADIMAQNLNWLVLPPIEIYDNQAVLHWESAPFQLPRYMDGYKVLVSTSGNYPEDFTDTIFVAAEMTEIVAASGETIDLDSFNFSAGYFHADMFTDTNYFEVLSDSTLAYGRLEPHSVSLAEYAGQTIYIAFLHDSFDDYYFSLDNILVTGSNEPNAVSAAENAEYRFITYPNPAYQQINLLYRLQEASQVGLSVVDLQGKNCITIATDMLQPAGEQQYKVSLAGLPSGSYFAVLTVNGNQMVKAFVKR